MPCEQCGNALEMVDRLAARGEFPNRSEAVRSAIRDLVAEKQVETDDRDQLLRAARRRLVDDHGTN